jgi:hypothetical protein
MFRQPVKRSKITHAMTEILKPHQGLSVDFPAMGTRVSRNITPTQVYGGSHFDPSDLHPGESAKHAQEWLDIDFTFRIRFLSDVRIPRDGDQHSEVMSIRIPK